MYLLVSVMFHCTSRKRCCSGSTTPGMNTSISCGAHFPVLTVSNSTVTEHCRFVSIGSLRWNILDVGIEVALGSHVCFPHLQRLKPAVDRSPPGKSDRASVWYCGATQADYDYSASGAYTVMRTSQHYRVDVSYRVRGIGGIGGIEWIGLFPQERNDGDRWMTRFSPTAAPRENDPRPRPVGSWPTGRVDRCPSLEGCIADE